MRTYVEVEVDLEDILDDMSDDELRAICTDRGIFGPTTSDSGALWEKVYYHFAKTGDAPQELRELIYQATGRIL